MLRRSLAFTQGRARLYATSAALGAAGVFYVWSTENAAGIAASMCGVFESGGRHGWEHAYTNDAAARVALPLVDADLSAILRPAAVEKYAVIVGPSGTGNSTAVRKLMRAAASEGGIAYFSAPELVADFSRGLADALGFREPIVLGEILRRLFVTRETKEVAAAPPLHDEPRASWSRLSRVLTAAAARYKVKHGTAPTLVLDAMDLVAKDDPAFFLVLQNFAKASADAGTLRVVFVFSDGAALPLLLSSSADLRSW